VTQRFVHTVYAFPKILAVKGHYVPKQFELIQEKKNTKHAHMKMEIKENATRTNTN
jgi:hypothetical protein